MNNYTQQLIEPIIITSFYFWKTFRLHQNGYIINNQYIKFLFWTTL